MKARQLVLATSYFHALARSAQPLSFGGCRKRFETVSGLLAHYCLDLAELFDTTRVVPVVIFLRGEGQPNITAQRAGNVINLSATPGSRP